MWAKSQAKPSQDLLKCMSLSHDIEARKSLMFGPQTERFSDDANCKSNHHNFNKKILQNPCKQSGYCSDDESSDCELEPCDSGRTRSAARKASQALNNDKTESEKVSENPDKASSSNRSKGRKRKKVGAGGDGSDSDPDDNREKSRLRLDEPEMIQKQNEDVEMICSCPKDVMRCIGILPSLPIITSYGDSDVSNSSDTDDLTHTVLPIVARPHKEGRAAGGEGDGC